MTQCLVLELAYVAISRVRTLQGLHLVAFEPSVHHGQFLADLREMNSLRAIHKCQGLPLDCALVDLSDKVFSVPGMAYVAISRVRTLQGLHLVAFEPKSIMVSTSCLNRERMLKKARSVSQADVEFLYQEPDLTLPIPLSG